MWLTLIVKHFYGFFSEDKIGEFAFVAGGFYDVIVYPMIVASAGFAKDDAVILKAELFEPLLGNFAVCFGTRGEKVNHVTFVIPFVYLC